MTFHLRGYTYCTLMSKIVRFAISCAAGYTCPWVGGVGAVPRGTGSHYARLGVSGRAEALPHARGSRLDVHTELFVYVGASRRSCQFLSPWEPPLGGGPDPYYVYYLVECRTESSGPGSIPGRGKMLFPFFHLLHIFC